MRLDGKSVLVTGAARGLGRATALACAAEGADLTLLDVCADLPGVPYPLGTPGSWRTRQRCAGRRARPSSPPRPTSGACGPYGRR